MSESRLISGVLATTHIDRHGERFSKQALERAAQYEADSDRPSWMNWNHQTTLPPVAIISRAWVEQREDGEYQLAFEGRLLGAEDYQSLPGSNVKGLDVTPEQLQHMIAGTPVPRSGSLEIGYDPRNFDKEEVEHSVEELNQLVDTEARAHVRKAAEAHSVIWVVVAFAGGLIVSGFLSRLGEVAADKVLEMAEPFYEELDDRFGRLLSTTKLGDPPDIIFNMTVAESDVIVEGAVEQAEQPTLRKVWAKLPQLHALATHLISRNPPGYFSEMKFLYNPATEQWEINFLTLRRSRSVILGPRYYSASHPLARRWAEERESMWRARADDDWAQ